MEAEAPVPDPLADGDKEHLAAFYEASEELIPFVYRGLFLLRTMLAARPPAVDEVQVNDFAAMACFARVYRQLRAATLLVAMGYYSEVATVLRGAFEAGAVGRYLAKQPEKAEVWLKKQEWIPDRKVRQWWGDEDRLYASWYRFYSARSHPTARACAPLLDIEGEHVSTKFTTTIDHDAIEGCLFEISWASLWACFALQNAAARIDILPPDWRQAVTEFASELAALMEARTGVKPDFSHLERDWEKDQQQWEEFVQRLPDAPEVNRILDEHPRSVRNMHP